MSVEIPPHEPVPRNQTDATLDQATPVQNTYYTILDTTLNARIIAIYGKVATTDENIQLKVTFDGIVIENTAAAGGINVYLEACLLQTGLFQWVAVDSISKFRAFHVEARSIKIEIRKTTNNGAGNLHGLVKYGKW